MNRLKGLAIMLLIGLLIGTACFFATYGTGEYVYEISTAEGEEEPEVDTAEEPGSVILETEEPDSTDESLQDDYDLMDDDGSD